VYPLLHYVPCPLTLPSVHQILVHFSSPTDGSISDLLFNIPKCLLIVPSSTSNQLIRALKYLRISLFIFLNIPI
jgi:hypothetical protein